MSLAIVRSRAALGLDAPLVTVEVHLSGGLPRVLIVGLPEAAVRESKDRVRSAILNANFRFPRQRITVNLAPADLPKDGGRFDLAIALGILRASRQLDGDSLPRHEFVGELALTGELRPTGAVLPAALACRDAGRALVVPREDAGEAALAARAEVLPAGDLPAVCAHLRGVQRLAPAPQHAVLAVPPGHEAPDLADVHGQHRARRALEVAAAGAHNLLLIGPPGTGKTMLATRLPGILPPMSESEALESAALFSVSAQRFDPAMWARRPFRAPHHTASAVALVGGGSKPRPGEVSLAHNGVLFLDELPEYERRVLEVLREPLESGSVCVSRAARQARFPARFQLVAAMNPCPCGHLGDGTERCRCSPERIVGYRARVSGPLLDRIDLHVEVPPLPRGAWRVPGAGTAQAAQPEGSPSVAARVATARRRQIERAGTPNAQLTPAQMRRHCRLAPAQAELLDSAIERLTLSARARERIMRVARTIADLDAAAAIDAKHLAEAIGYRALERTRV